MAEIGKLYDLAFPIAMKPCGIDLVCMLMGGIRQVFMMGDKIMQKKLGSDAEGKDQQHQSA